jgi:hypothetical protein
VNDDWTHILAMFNLDPDVFEVVEDTVRMSTWQQSKGLDDGSRDVVQLYSYSARFRRVTAGRITPAVVESWREDLVDTFSKPALYNLRRVDPVSATYAIFVADPQLGKKNTAQAVENWKRGVARHMAEVYACKPSRIHVAFMGDEHENVMGNYANQPHTIELRRGAQLDLDFDLRVWTMREALRLGLPVSASSVISNHGEWTRHGDTKEVVTTSNDNSSTYIASQVKKLFDELEPHTGQHVDWTIGDTHPGIVLNLSGVKTYLSHGYIEKGRGPSVELRTRNAIERQILGRTDELGDVRVYVMAHYHHAYMNTFEGRTLWGCPALEAERSSEYMLDQYGVWSRPGMLGMLIGDHAVDGWSHANVY